MEGERTTVLVTGVAGNLGCRLLPQLSEFRVVGVDMAAPPENLQRFQQMDLGEERSCEELVALLRESRAAAVVHLAFVIDPQRTGVLERERMWQINVAGTARVCEAIAVVNRTGGGVRKFVFPSSVSAYGPETPGPVREDHPLAAHTLPYAIHKQESDEVVQERVPSLGDCRTYLLRPHIFTGATMQNYLVGVLRGTPTGKSKRAARWREQGKRLPMTLPFGDQYLEKKLQVVHVDDMARLIEHILRRPEGDPTLTILNVAAPGAPITLQRCAQIAQARVRRAPRWLMKFMLRRMWNSGFSAIPPEALPYMIGSYTMDTHRLQHFLGTEYRQVMQHDMEAALADSFVKSSS